MANYCHKTEHIFFFVEVFGMNWRRTSLSELVFIRYHDQNATLEDKAAAENEIIRRQRKQRLQQAGLLYE